MKNIMSATLFVAVLVSLVATLLMFPTTTVKADTSVNQANSACTTYLTLSSCYTDCQLNSNCYFPDTSQFGYLCTRKNLYLYLNGQYVGSTTGGGCYLNYQNNCVSTCY